MRIELERGLFVTLWMLFPPEHQHERGHLLCRNQQSSHLRVMRRAQRDH